MNDLLNKHCVPYSSDDSDRKGILSQSQTMELLQQVPKWQFKASTNCIERTFKFANFHQTMAFVAEIATIIHAEDHHPQMTLNYASCKLEYTTHSIDAISLNDFICAAKIDHIFKASKTTMD